MDIWGMLGIPPTNDVAKIKSAYARQAKLYHPEEHPEEFKALQGAYKTALQIAKRRQGTETFYVPPKTEPEPDSESEQESGHTEDISGKEAEPEQKEERSFDYSDVDAYGDRERFFKQFFLLKKNPYLKNNLDAWEYFLNLEEYHRLFAGASFRMNFVRTVCSEFGWRRKTILCFKRHLSKFYTKENTPSNEKLETKFFMFRMKQLPWPKLPAFLTDHYWGEEGKRFQRYLLSKVKDAVGREPDLKIEADLMRYIEFYLAYGEVKEAYINHLWDTQESRRILLGSIICVFCIFAGLAGMNSIEQRVEGRNRLKQMDYLMELYDLEPDTYSDEEQAQIVKDYNSYWRYAEEAIDDVLNRYEDWNLP